MANFGPIASLKIISLADARARRGLYLNGEARQAAVCGLQGLNVVCFERIRYERKLYLIDPPV